MRIRDRIADYLRQHPEGVDDDALAEKLELKRRQQANSCCRELQKDGLVIRRRVRGKLHNFWVGGDYLERPPSDLTQSPAVGEDVDGARPWFWEGNVQATVVRCLEEQGWTIRSVAHTASRQPGKDIVAERNGQQMWISVKGYPTKSVSAQAAHWFKQAVFDIIKYRGESASADLGLALPDYPRYRALSTRINWFQPVAGFSYYWVSQSGEVLVE